MEIRERAWYGIRDRAPGRLESRPGPPAPAYAPLDGLSDLAALRGAIVGRPLKPNELERVIARYR